MTNEEALERINKCIKNTKRDIKASQKRTDWGKDLHISFNDGVISGLVTSIKILEQLPDTKEKECELEQFEYDLKENEWTTCDIKFRCSNCKTRIYETPKTRYCEYCGAKIKRGEG